VKVELIREWRRFYDLAEEWNPLLKASGADTLFLTWEWLASWSTVVGGTIQPFVVTVRGDDASLVGVAAYYWTKYEFSSILPVRILRFMADFATGAEYPDWILKKGAEPAAAMAIAGALRTARSEWDCIWMTNVAGWTGTRERITSACQVEGLKIRCRPRDFAHYSLPDSKEAYLGTLTTNRRSQIGRQVRRVLSREGTGFSRCSRAEDIPRYLDNLFDLNRRRWAALGQEGPFLRRPDAVRFYRHFVPEALSAGWLRLYALEEKDEIKAIQIG
jgi:CelD/BcsL family acetyltransferase involved in cellulose biosynthesis